MLKVLLAKKEYEIKKISPRSHEQKYYRLQRQIESLKQEINER